jgi:hypothetical protein
MAIPMMDFGKIIIMKEKVHTVLKMVVYTKVNGKMANIMEKAKYLIIMAINMKVILKMI